MNSRISFALLLVGVLSIGLRAGETCKSCHLDVYEKWQSSHHAKAMMVADAQSVLGDFDGATIDHHGQSATFTMGDGYQVAIKDKDREAEIYTIAYTFGVTPLQQYLVETERGKYQLLPFAWDSRSENEGGQRWFHIYPDEYIPAADRLHWQQPLQNWNGMCADCHSTGLKRNYDPASDVFKTTFDSVNVSCASCHAGAEEHAQSPKPYGIITDGWQDDLVSYLEDIDGFELKEGDHTATWSGSQPRARPEMQVCAACHSLRAPLSDGIDPAKPFLDQFAPTLLDDPLYFADGQIREEVYVWGSFQQSKMFMAGVSCFDCHDSHSLKLKAEGNGVCTQCHSAPVFDTPEHHNHPVETEGAMCVNCHMPERTYMVVDPRRDHGFKIPRPADSIATGSPNACTTCHEGASNKWASDTLKSWYPNSVLRQSHASVIHQAGKGNPRMRLRLTALIQDESQPPIVRATALSLVPRVANERLIEVAKDKLKNTSPLIRIGAIRALASLSPDKQVAFIAPLMADDLKAVRVEAARALLFAPSVDMTSPAFAELLAADRISSWRGEGRANLALHAVASNDTSAAEKEYRKALGVDPYFAPVLINLAELLRRSGKEDESHQLLVDAVNSDTPIDAALYHAYGLSEIRQGNRGAAVEALEKATKGERDNARYAYVYLVALHGTGEKENAFRGVKTALRRHRYDRDLLELAYSLARENGDNRYLTQIEKRLRALND